MHFNDDDSVLEELLLKMNCSTELSEVKDLILGMAAAPYPFDDMQWQDNLESCLGKSIDASLQEKFLELRKILVLQSDGIGERDMAVKRIMDLRKYLTRLNLSGFIIPLSDEYQGEYLASHSKRLAWITGFTGSAGMAVILTDNAAIFTDGRYTLQVKEQVDSSIFTKHHIAETSPYTWLQENLKLGMNIGFDPWLHSVDQRSRLEEACNQSGCNLVPCKSNPIDEIWLNQSPAPIGPIVPYEYRFSGRKSADKRLAVSKLVKAAGANVAFLNAPDSIAWLLNVRGGDVKYSPLPHSFALLWGDGKLTWFVDNRKLTPNLSEHLGSDVTCISIQLLGKILDSLDKNVSIQIDTSQVPDWVYQRLHKVGANIIKAPDPCLIPKACKNKVEIEGIQNAHIRDGVALTRFLHWLSAVGVADHISELQAAEKLATFREGATFYKGPSFDTISGSAGNGAIVHYSVSPESDKILKSGTLYLVDSGGQYLDGTTDVTRTVAIGTPTAEHQDRFTRVLKGHIALAGARFPFGTTGAQLDFLARQHLYYVGLDYDHGTGHGVGAYLNVHEGPQRISKHSGQVELQPGMVISNEPGYYKTGEYGIRIENLISVVNVSNKETSEQDVLAFETLTMAPIDISLIDLNIMTKEECSWLNTYHKSVRDKLTPKLCNWPEVVDWLFAATLPINIE